MQQHKLINPIRYGAVAAVAAAVIALASPRAEAAGLAVVPVLIGPLQVLVAVLPAILAALGGAMLALFKPSALKTAARVLWRNKIAATCVVGVVGGLVYAVPHVRAFFGPEVSQDVCDGGEWPAFHGGASRRGMAPGSDDPTTAGAVWAFSSEVSTFYASPAVVGKRVYVTSADKTVFSDRGAIYCLDADSGAIVWKHSPSGFRATFSSPAVAEGYVVGGEGLHFVRDGRVTCLRADGKLVWELRTKSHVESSPCIYKGKAYVGAGDDGLYCIALEPGPDGKARVLWHLETKDYPDCEASPVACDGKVFFGLGDNGCGVCCADAETGKPVWRTATPYPVFTAPAIGDGKVFVGMGNGNYIDSAAKLWDKRLDELKKRAASAAEIAAAKQKFAPAGEVWALDVATGKPVAKLQLKETVLGAIAVADAQVYFASRDGLVTCTDTHLKVLKQWNAKDSILTSPAVGKDQVCLMTEGGRLLCLDRRSLKPIWESQVDTGSCLSSPAIGCGHVYVGTSGRGLVCFGRAGATQAPTWAGALGGPGRSGWADATPPPARGDVAWQYPARAAEPVGTPTTLDASPAYLDGSLYVGLYRGERKGLVRLALSVNPREVPTEKWLYATPNRLYASAALEGSRAYVVDGKPGDKGRSLHAVVAATGQAAWTFPVADDATGEFVLAQDRLLLCDGAERLTCLQLADDKPGAVWSVPVGRTVGSPAVVKDLVLAAGASVGEGLVALDLADGKKRWQRTLSARPTTGPVATADFVAVGTEGGLTVCSLVDGSILWSAGAWAAKGVLVCDEDRVACTTAAGEIVVRDWFGHEIVRLQGVREGLPPMLCGDQMVYLRPQAIERLEFPSLKTSQWLAADWLAETAAPPILVNAHLYFSTRTRGLLAAGPGD